jgi:uncharacterized protein
MDNDSLGICKITIQGTWKSGKKTLVQTISEIGEATEENRFSTVRYGLGRITSEDQTVILYLFAIPMARRFDFERDLAEGSLGFILMIDSCHPEMFREARAMFETLMVYSPLPIVIVANFQDSPDAWDMDALRIALRIPNDIPIIPCVATDRESVKGVMIAFLNEVLKDIEAEVDE